MHESVLYIIISTLYCIRKWVCGNTWKQTKKRMVNLKLESHVCESVEQRRDRCRWGCTYQSKSLCSCSKQNRVMTSLHSVVHTFNCWLLPFSRVETSGSSADKEYLPCLLQTYEAAFASQEKIAKNGCAHVIACDWSGGVGNSKLRLRMLAKMKPNALN